MKREEDTDEMIGEPHDLVMENTSGQGRSATIPKEIRGWNWGAFVFGWLWGISNRVWISLLSAIPYVGVIMLIVLGVKGNEWAWRKKKWDSIEHFKNTQRKWGIAAAVVFVLGLIIVIVVLIAGSVPPTRPAPQPESPIEEGWVRLRIEDVGSIDYPPDFLELQSEDYRDIAKEISPNLVALVFRLGKSDFTLQQVGLNELKPSAFNEYRRVIFRTEYLNSGEEVFRTNEKYTLSQEELAEFKNELIDQLRQEYAKLQSMGLGNNKIIDSGSVEIMEINGMFPLVHTYKRQLNDNPLVLVKSYMFWDYNRIHSLSFSYRITDEEECRDIYEKILYSFRLQ